MEAVGAAAGVATLIELAAKIGSVCGQYMVAVKNAAKDINRLQKEVKELQDLLEQVNRLLDGPGASKLATSRVMKDGIETCKSELQALNQRLSPSKARKLMSRVNTQVLKWPFETADVDKFLHQLKSCKLSISLALQVDQTHLTLALHHKVDLAKLPSAEGAAFDSHTDEQNPRCHPDTRIGLRDQITQWAVNRRSKGIFWLCGIAGTGKSTISRTVAQHFAEQCTLAASFFFKRGGGDRGNASRFFTTIISQMIVKLPALSPFVSEAIEADPSLTTKSLKDQFNKLFLQPLSKIPTPKQAPRMVIVVDALDECEQEEHVKTILSLLSRAPSVASVSLRIFVTSRPDLAIRLGFKNICSGVYQDFILHEIPRPTIKRDIAIYLNATFSTIRDEHNSLYPRHQLPSDWPGDANIQTLAGMAVPLFIFAATVCRFVGDHKCNPRQRLQSILTQAARHVSQLDQTYCPILDAWLTARSDDEHPEAVFKNVVGSLILLASPLSAIALATLLRIDEANVDSTLIDLHSVLSVPTDGETPIQLLHLSFRECLIDPNKEGNSPLWINKRKTHEMLTTKCLESMSHSLKENLCGIFSPGTLRSDISNQIIDHTLTADVRYACLYWVHHLEQSGGQITDWDSAHNFLSNHFLHWLEALSLMGRIQEGAAMLEQLETYLTPNSSDQFASLIFDAKRFLTKNQTLIGGAPLQLYSSALVFSPTTSIVRDLFKGKIPAWIQELPNVKSTWSAELRALDGHTNGVTAVAFSPDGKLLASASYDNTVRLWDPTTGTAVQTLEGHTAKVTAVAFSPDGKLLTSASWDKTVRLWDPTTGTAVQRLEGHTDVVTAVAFSPDGKLLASASYDNTVRLWDPATGTVVQTLEGHTNGVTAVVFSPDGKLLASASYDKTVRLWDPATGATVQMFEDVGYPNHLQFSSDGQYLNTDRGSLYIQQPTKKMALSLVKNPQLDIFYKDEWVSISGERRLWLPPDYRPVQTAVNDNILVLGLQHGPVVFISFLAISSKS